jgi:hypothetical protein
MPKTFSKMLSAWTTSCDTPERFQFNLEKMILPDLHHKFCSIHPRRTVLVNAILPFVLKFPKTKKTSVAEFQFRFRARCAADILSAEFV